MRDTLKDTLICTVVGGVLHHTLHHSINAVMQYRSERVVQETRWKQLMKMAREGSFAGWDYFHHLT